MTDKAGYFSENKALLKAQTDAVQSIPGSIDTKPALNNLIEPAVKKQLTLHFQLIGKLLRVFS